MTEEKQDRGHVDIGNARQPDQMEVMQKIIDAGDDPFSLENLQKYHKFPILKIGTWWLVTENQWPYKDTRKHFLIIYHADYPKTLKEIKPEAFMELLAFAEEITAIHEVKGGALCMRFGDTKLSGATVNRIHFHLIEPENPEETGPVLFRIGTKKKES